jgi:NADH-quinone oxidoreductase subunit N
MLNNIYFLLPEIYLSVVSVTLLGCGVVFIKFQERVSQLLKINYLTAISLVFAAFILFSFSTDNETVYISDSLLFLNNQVTLVKIVLLISSAILLVLPNKIADYEFSQLILLSVIGMMILVSANDIIIIYLAIELMSLSFYVLAAINRNSQHSTEAGIKYFLLGALSSGILLFGMALVYAYTGETNLQAISSFVSYSSSIELTLAALFIFIALLFKLAAAPFHM